MNLPTSHEFGWTRYRKSFVHFCAISIINNVVFGQNSYICTIVVAIGKMDVFGEKACIWAEWLRLDKIVVLAQRWVCLDRMIVF